MKEYFQVNKHSLGTRNQNCLLKLPKLGLELGRQTFAYSGAKLCNDLPTNLRKEENFLIFTKYIKSYNFQIQNLSFSLKFLVDAFDTSSSFGILS